MKFHSSISKIVTCERFRNLVTFIFGNYRFTCCGHNWALRGFKFGQSLYFYGPNIAAKLQIDTSKTVEKVPRGGHRLNMKNCMKILAVLKMWLSVFRGLAWASSFQIWKLLHIIWPLFGMMYLPCFNGSKLF